MMASHNQLLVLGSAAQLPSFHTSITTVSFRCLGSFARCGFSVRVCQTSTWKKRRRGVRKSADSGKCLGINNEWTGCYAWINTAQMQVVGKAKLSHVRPKTQVDIVWIKSADSWYFVPKNFLCVCQSRKMSEKAFKKSWGWRAGGRVVSAHAI